MAGVNKVILVGHLGADPELRYTPNGQGVCELRIATSESWNDKQGQKQERTEWHRVVVWGKRAEICAKYLAKGRQAYVEGRLQTRSYDDKEGVKRYTTEIIANDIQFIGGGKGDGANRGGNDIPPPSGEDYGWFSGGYSSGNGGDDDIPF